MLFDTKVHSIKHIKVKKKAIKNLNTFLGSFTSVGMKTIVTEKHVIIPFSKDPNIVEWRLQYALATAYSSCESFHLKIQIRD